MSPKNSKARIAANARHTAKAYDRVYGYVKKGEKEKIQRAAENEGMSINSLLSIATYDKLESLGYVKKDGDSWIWLK